VHKKVALWGNLVPVNIKIPPGGAYKYHIILTFYRWGGGTDRFDLAEAPVLFRFCVA
jgi:hypothetical protein